MDRTFQNKLHIDRMWGLFIGQFDDNVLHRHYALQISAASGGTLEITDEHNQQASYSLCLVSSTVPHQFSSQEPSLILLINPLSSIGHQLHNKYGNERIVSLTEDLTQLPELLTIYLQNELDFTDLVQEISRCLEDFKCACELENHVADIRIYQAIDYLEQHFDRIVSLEEIAGFCFLSETRFLHLFKEKTNLNFRRYQLWNKLIKSLPYLKTYSITETAHQFGFTDSSHYSRTFKETFGLSPKLLSAIK